MTRKQKLALYVAASTENPTGWRPWNSRLSYYAPNSFAIPTTGQGPFLLQPGVMARPSAAGGLGAMQTPNYPTFNRARSWTTHGGYPTPVYRAPGISGLGQGSRSSRRRVRRALGLGAAPRTNVSYRRDTAPSFTSVMTTPRTVTPISSIGAGAAILNPAAPSWNPSSPQRSAPWNFAPHATTPTATQQQGCYVTEQGGITSYVLASTGQCGPVASSSGWQSWQSSQNQTPWQQWQNQNYGNQNSYAQQLAQQQAAEAQANADALAAAGTSTTAATTTTAAAPATTTSWFTEDSLGFGLPNIAYLGIAVGGILLLKRR